MKPGPGVICAQLNALREAAGYTQEGLATIASLSVHGVSALEREATTASCRDRSGTVRRVPFVGIFVLGRKAE